MFEILYIEDDELCKEITLLRLKHQLLNVTHVTYANDAYDKLKTRNYDMIITDNLTPPNGTGVELINKLFLSPDEFMTKGNIPIAFITSNVQLAKDTLDTTNGISFFDKTDNMKSWVLDKLVNINLLNPLLDN